MSWKLSKVLAPVAVLASSSLALAQDGTTASFDWVAFAGVLGPLAAVIWFILFVRWGGFRWLY